MNYKKLQSQYDKIYSYFRGSTEPFDSLEWNGKFLAVWLNDNIVEQYSVQDLDFVFIDKG